MYRRPFSLLIRPGLGLAVALTLPAQSGDTQTRMADVLRYTGIENPPPSDVVRMVELWTRAQQPGLASAERRLAFRDLYLLYNKLHGRDLTARPQALDGFAQFVTATFE